MRIKIEDCRQLVQAHYGISRTDMLGPVRRLKLARQRQIAMYLARELTKASLPAIGLHFGGRDHTTVLHAHRRIGKMVAADDKFAAEVEDIRHSLEVYQALNYVPLTAKMLREQTTKAKKPEKQATQPLIPAVGSVPAWRIRAERKAA